MICLFEGFLLNRTDASRQVTQLGQFSLAGRARKARVKQLLDNSTAGGSNLIGIIPSINSGIGNLKTTKSYQILNLPQSKFSLCSKTQTK